MADIIRLLSDAVANQIAAGEVIQRPASVLKELLENSVDAGATEVHVIIRDAGRSLVQVVDNGCGMSETDARMAFERHATSKIRHADDLFAIRTMGFRGEALASIAAVAQVELKTRRLEDELGTAIVIHGSKLVSHEACSMNPGSNFSVKNLFYNVPARRKFLKSDATEFRHIITEFHRVCLVCPNITFTFHHNDTEVYNLFPGMLRQRLITVFGKQLNQALIPLETETSIVSISGFIGKPEFAKKTMGEQFFFVNNRFVRHPYLQKAIIQGYEQILPPDVYPTYFIYLTSDPAFIDVNIHPSKTEIKFEDEKAVWQLLHATVREAIGKYNLVPSLDFNQDNVPEIPIFRKNGEVKIPPTGVDHLYNPFSTQAGRADKPTIRHWEKAFELLRKESSEEQSALPMESADMKYFQLKGHYILLSVRSGLMMIDQKRAHERVLFEHYLSILGTGKVASQADLFPRTLTLDPADHVLMLDMMDDLNRLGFDIHDLGHGTIAVNGYPSDAGIHDPAQVIETFLEEYKETGRDPLVTAREKTARSMAVATAIPYGKELGQEEMRQLADQLFACEAPGYTPSGKPTVVILRLDDIEKMF